MATIYNSNPASGAPGIEPRWTRSDKDGVGTAYSTLSQIWFTVSKGILNEVYYPTIDQPQIRDLQYLISDGETFVHDERQLENVHELLAPNALGYRIINRDPKGRYQITKEVISAPHQPCILIHTKIEAEPELLKKLHIYALLSPHLEVGGRQNNGNVVDTGAGKVLAAHKGHTWLVLDSTIGFLRASCGYAGTTDGWQDLEKNLKMSWEFDSAPEGNIALIGELNLEKGHEFVLALTFGESLHHALVSNAQTLASAFAKHKATFLAEWQRSQSHLLQGKSAAAGDGGKLYQASHSLLLAHEDKIYDGALIASLSIPWGEVMGDDDLGGYHLVWTRDLCHSANGLLSAGSSEVALRTLIYLACSQNADGGFFQNFWINGEPHWHGIQLDEVAFPIMLAWHLHEAKGLEEFDPYPLVMKAAGYLVRHGPVTPQERWEETSGYSPSTLAAQIAALVCAGAFSRSRGHEARARYFEEYADFLEAHVDGWTVTTQGTLVKGISRHFIRIHPASPFDPSPDEDANNGLLVLQNRPPDSPESMPAKEMVDAGFLELVRYGIRKPDALFEDSLKVIDAVIKVNTPVGPCWRRYNNDYYGQRADGGPFEGFGYGHAWPVLTGERGHYELAAGRDVKPYIKAMEGFATATKLLAEQIWCLPDLPAAHMTFGLPTGGAMPLAWAHAEYLKLVRSAVDGQVFDRIPLVADRYLKPRKPLKLELWKFNRQLRAVAPGTTLRVQAEAPFHLIWTDDEWKKTNKSESTGLDIGVEYVDIKVAPEQRAPLRFTFFWPGAQRWEGRNVEVAILGK